MESWTSESLFIESSAVIWGVTGIEPANDESGIFPGMGLPASTDRESAAEKVTAGNNKTAMNNVILVYDLIGSEKYVLLRTGEIDKISFIDAIFHLCIKLIYAVYLFLLSTF